MTNLDQTGDRERSLRSAVIKNDIAVADALIEGEEDTLERIAPLLGLACRYAGADMVDLLLDRVEENAPAAGERSLRRFAERPLSPLLSLRQTWGRMRKGDVSVSQLYMFGRRETAQREFARDKSLPYGRTPGDYLTYLFPDPAAPEDQEAQILSAAKRAEVALTLLRHGAESPYEILFQAGLHGDAELIRLLGKAGIKPERSKLVSAKNDPSGSRNAAPKLSAADSADIVGAVIAAPPDQAARIIKAFRRMIGKPIPFARSAYIAESNGDFVHPAFCRPGVFEEVWANTDMQEKMTRKAVLGGLAAAGNLSDAKRLLDEGYFSRRPTLETGAALVKERFPEQKEMLKLFEERLGPRKE